MKTVIVGGVAGGATVAARLRRNSEEAAITILERGPHISYANCGLPYYIGGVIAERDRLFVQTPEGFEENFNIDVQVNHEVLTIDRAKKQVLVRSVKGQGGGAADGEWVSYDKLVLSPGAEPVRPPIPGINDPAIFTLRSVRETDAIKEFIGKERPQRAVVVGAGFIGLEMAENLHELGMAVTIVEMADQVMNVVDYEMAAEVHQHLKTKNVEFYLQDGVASFEREGKSLRIALQSGRELPADIVILSIGVRPESRLAKEAGLEIGKTGGIKVNAHLQTSDPDIYAVGDAIEFPNPITGQAAITYLAGPANKQGRIVADNIAWGNDHEYPGAIGTAVAKVFDLTVATTGASEKTLRTHKTPFKAVITHSSSHAGYYPDAVAMSIKTLFDPGTGRVLGAQIVGYEGVDKRIDLFAAIIRAKGTIHDLTELEHAYAPPYSSAKDPVNIAGFVAENVFLGRSRHIHWHEIMGCDLSELVLLDVRTKEEFELATIEGAVNIPVQERRHRHNEVPKDKTVVVFCGVGLRAYRGERILRQHGYQDIYNLSGGYKTYEYATQKQSNEDLFAADFIHKDDNIYQVDPEPPSSGDGHGNGARAPAPASYSPTPEDKPIIPVLTDAPEGALASIDLALSAATEGSRPILFFSFSGLRVITAGDAPRAIKKRIKDLNLPPLKEMLNRAVDSGVRLVACGASMERMGISKSDLVESVTIGGAKDYLTRVQNGRPRGVPVV